MKSDDIIMKTGIVHILDSSVGVPVLSDCPIDLSGDLSDFLKAHIEKLTESDDVKLCRFGNDSPVKQLLEQCTPGNLCGDQQAAGPAALRHYER